MADGIVQYIISLTDRTGGASQSATGNAEKMSVGFDTAAKAALGVAAAIGTAVAAGTALASLTQEVADFRNDIGDAATRSGIAADTLQGLQVAAEGAGLQFGSLLSGLDQFGARLSQAASGTNRTSEAFETLGVAVTDAEGNLRDGDAVLRETLSALNDMEPSAARSALAVETLGRSGGRLLQAFSGSELEDFVSLADEFGVDVGPAAAKSAGEWQRAVAELDLVVRGLKSAFVDSFGIGADQVFEFTSSFVASTAIIKSFDSTFTSVAVKIANSIGALYDVLGTQIDRVIARAVGFAQVASALSSGSGVVEAYKSATEDIAAADEAFGVSARRRDAILSQTSDSIGDAAEQATAEALKSVNNLESIRAAIRAGSRSENGGNGGGGAPPERDVNSNVESEATVAAEAASRVFASGYTEDRKRLSDVLAEGAENIANQAVATGEAASAALRDTLQGVSRGLGIAETGLSGNLGGALTQAGMASGNPGLAAAGAGVQLLDFIGEEGAAGIERALQDQTSNLLAALEALPELIGEILPAFAVNLVAKLVPALVESIDGIVVALITELPNALAKAIVNALKGGGRDEDDELFIDGAFGLNDFIDEKLGEDFGNIEIGKDRDGDSRSSRSSRAARTATDGQRSTARESDRLAQMSTRRRRNRATVRQNPFDAMARQYDAQYGTLGRASSTTIGAT